MKKYQTKNGEPRLRKASQLALFNLDTKASPFFFYEAYVCKYLPRRLTR